jgi:hypothetical protein
MSNIDENIIGGNISISYIIGGGIILACIIFLTLVLSGYFDDGKDINVNCDSAVDSALAIAYDKANVALDAANAAADDAADAAAADASNVALSASVASADAVAAATSAAADAVAAATSANIKSNKERLRIMSKGDVCVSGSCINRLYSISGVYKLQVTGSGNLVVYNLDPKRHFGVWAAKVRGINEVGGTYTLNLGTNGNLVLSEVIDDEEEMLWESGVSGNNGPYRAIMQSSGILEIQDVDSDILWSTADV